MDKLRNQKGISFQSPKTFLGFTILEVLVSLAILSIVGALATQTFQVANESRKAALSTVDIYEKGRAAIDLISRDLQSVYMTDAGRSFLTREDPSYPQPRFVGVNIWQDVGNGLDDDGDGLSDEEWLDGLDNDGDGLIDERDYKKLPRDILFFASSQDNKGNYDLMEIAYTVNSAISDQQRLTYQTGRYDVLMRYSAVLNEDPLDFAIPETNFITPDAGDGESYDPVAYGILGINFSYYYYDYQEDSDGEDLGWRKTFEWHSASESAAGQFASTDNVLGSAYPYAIGQGDTIFQKDNLFRKPRYPMYNEKEDLVYLTTDTRDDEGDVKTDGLPYMVEVTIWIDDDDGYLGELTTETDTGRIVQGIPPKVLKTRIFLPVQ